ncbi:hypothetical protein ACFLZZ_04125 [Nanoarchaeota archaeon]
MFNKRGQITLFTIIAILIVATIGLVAYLGGVGPFGVPSELLPIEDRIIECIQETALEGAEVLGAQGGYINPPEFEAGSEYAPFTSQIGFFGSVMPYWFYLSSNGQYKEQVPSIKTMEDQLSDYIKDNLEFCDVEDLLVGEYIIEIDEAIDVKADIREREIFIEAEMPVSVEYQGTSRRIISYDTKINSNVGRLYNIAREVYDAEQSRLFLEDYTVDLLALYVPGTDVELRCSPRIWFRDEVEEDLLDALQANIPAIRVSGDYYELSQEKEYYVTELEQDLKKEQVNFFYDKAFPTKIEIQPSDGEVMRANPVGNQEGLGILGFCYVPYHFVYSVSYPVIVQVFDEEYGLFQFPIIVSVKNNQPRGAVIGEEVDEFELELCEYKVQDFNVRTIDTSGRELEASIGFKCGGTFCPIGESYEGNFDGQFPQCVNGFIIAQEEGYIDSKVQVSTNQFGSADIIMRPKHELDVRVLGNLQPISKEESAFITFSSEDWTTSILYPTQDKVELAEGDYTVTSYLFRDGRIVLSAQSVEKCVQVPKTGIFGFLGFEREECYNIDQPAQELSQITIGGGTAEVSFEDSELRNADFVGVEIIAQPVPSNVLELQEVYTNLFSSTIGITLR